MKILWIYICTYIYESLARAIKILLQLFKVNPNENARIYLEYRCIGKYCHPACCATFTVPRIFRWIPWNLSSRFLSFLFFSFRIAHGGKLSKGCIHPTLRFPVGVPINRREIVSTFQARDVIPIHSDVAFARVSTFVTSSDAPLIIRDLGPDLVCACFEDERPRTEYWYASERFNASLMDTAIYIYIYRRRTREEFECLIERFRRAKCYINIYISLEIEIYFLEIIWIFNDFQSSTNECFIHSRNIIGSEAYSKYPNSRKSMVH